MDDMFLNEFRPPDDSMIDFMLGMSVALNVISEKPGIEEQDSEVLARASHSMKVMLAMAVGGHFLFTSEAKHSDALAELAGNLYDRLLLSGADDGVDLQALHDFRSYREEGPDVEDMPYFGENSDGGSL